MQADETFSEPEPNLIVSSSGFSVRVLGRTGMRYTEGDRSVFIDSEVLATPSAIALFKDKMTESAPGETQPVTPADRERIAGNVERAFRSCGYDIEVHANYDWL